MKLGLFASLKSRALIGLIAALLPLTAFADFLNMNGDGVVTISTQPLAEEFAVDFGTVCQGSGVLSRTFQLEVAARSHGDLVTNANIIFQNGSPVTVAVSSINGGGIGASVAAPGTIVLPNNWTSLADGTLSASVNSTVTLDTSTAGSVSGTVVYGASGTNLNGGVLTKFSTLDVKGNVVACGGEVTVKKTAAASAINSGDVASFNIVVSSLGPAAATNGVLTDVLPTGLTWTVSGADATAAGCAGTLAGGSTLTCNFGTLAVGATRTVTVSAKTADSNCGTIDNTAHVSATNDTNTGNNDSTARISVACKPSAQITPTNTTCQQFLSGTAATLSGINYNLKNGVINNVAPGVAFYFVKVTASGSSFTVATSQSDNGTSPAFDARQVQVFDANCNTYSNFTSSISTSLVTTNVSGATAGQTYVVLFKIDPHSVVGTPAPTPSTVTYTYTTALNSVPVPGSTQSITLSPF